MSTTSGNYERATPNHYMAEVRQKGNLSVVLEDSNK